MENTQEQELFRSEYGDVRVQEHTGASTESGRYKLLVGNRIVMSASDLGFANLIASALARMIPPGCGSPLETALDGLRDLVEARELLAGIVSREARVHGRMSEAMQRAAARMRGAGYKVDDEHV